MQLQIVPLIIVGAYLIGMLIVGFVVGAPKIRKTMAVTIPEVVGRRFGRGASTFTAVLSILSLFCLTSSQIAASGTVVATLTGIPLNVSLVIAGLVIILYTTFGGMIADQISDLVQFIIILVGLAIATPIVIKSCGGWAAISAALPGEQLSISKIGWMPIIGYIFNYFCTFLAGPEMVSRFETAKDERTARNAAWLSSWRPCPSSPPCWAWRPWR